MSNESRIKTSGDLEKFVESRIRFGLSDTQIFSVLKAMEASKGLGYSEVVLKSAIKSICDNYLDYRLIQKVMGSYIVVDAKGKDYIIVDTTSRLYFPISKDNLNALFDPKMDLRPRKCTAIFKYLPFETDILTRTEDELGWYFNTYSPPEWYSDYFFSKGKKAVPVVNTIPSMYHKFLIHLVDGDKDSYTYILDWLSHSIKSRNYCILTTIGNQGIGKGVLGELMRFIHGESNYFTGSDSMFKSQFNSQMGDKRIVYCDEISIKNKQEEDRLKLVVNDFIEVRKLYHDATQNRNYASFYISSNNMDSIRLTADDRRFSVINLTDTPLIKVMTALEISELLKQENVSELARFLYNRKYDEKKMNRVFITDRTSEVRSAGLKEWEDWFLCEFCMDKADSEMEVSTVSDKIEDKFGKIRPGRAGLKRLQGMYPNKFKVSKVTKDDKRVWVVIFKPKKEQESE